MKVVFITEGGKDIGMGHIARCIALYQAFENKGARPLIIVNCDKSAEHFLKGNNHVVLNWLKDAQQLWDHVKDAEIAVLDSYMGNSLIYRQVSGTVCLAVYIDDYKRMDYPDGIVLNSSLTKEDMREQLSEGKIYLTGSEYTVLRKEFWDVKEKNIEQEVRNIAVIFGGNDIRNMTPAIKVFLDREYSTLRQNIVTGSLGAEKLRDIMLDSDMAISAGGQTLLELVRVGVPTVTICVSENQINNINSMLNAGCIQYAGRSENKGILPNLKQSISMIMDFEKRRNLSTACRTLIDGKGALRVVDFIYSKVCNR